MPSLRELTAGMPRTDFWCAFCRCYRPLAVQVRAKKLLNRKGKIITIPPKCNACARRSAGAPNS